MSASELAEWQAYHSIEPFPDERSDMLLANIAAILVNAHRDSGSSSEITAMDFLPWLDNSSYASSDDDEPVDPESMVAYVEAFNAAFGGKDLRGVDLVPSKPDLVDQE